MLVREKPKLYRSRINREEIAPETYRKLFRFDKENVEWLAHRFIPEHDEKRGGCLTTVESMEATLHYLADPGYQTTVNTLLVCETRLCSPMNDVRTGVTSLLLRS